MPRRKKRSAGSPDHGARRESLVDELASFVLRKGLGDMSLRRLAGQHGTSDRMLLYYFRDKDDLVIAVLHRVSERLSAILARYSTGQTVPAGRFLAGVLALLGDAQIAPFLRLWAEVIARGARGEQPYRKIATGVVSDWLRWIEGRLGLPPGGSERNRAAAILAIVEGVTLLEMASPGSTKGAGAFLASRLDAG
jgi:AcrR family transcriptional regulator